MKKLFLLMSVLLASCSDPTERFESSKWLVTPEGERYAMARDLVDRDVLHGKSAQEVEALLGRPSAVAADEARLTSVVKLGSYSFSQVFTLEVQLDASSGMVAPAAIQGD